ncbi:hypothetical protein DIPPA_26919 [Diplonema papillatum]|nr:hypothetical protein DIPPA_26919 [Diplonema papillatum]
MPFVELDSFRVSGRMNQTGYVLQSEDYKQLVERGVSPPDAPDVMQPISKKEWLTQLRAWENKVKVLAERELRGNTGAVTPCPASPTSSMASSSRAASPVHGLASPRSMQHFNSSPHRRSSLSMQPLTNGRMNGNGYDPNSNSNFSSPVLSNLPFSQAASPNASYKANNPTSSPTFSLSPAAPNDHTMVHSPHQHLQQQVQHQPAYPQQQQQQQQQQQPQPQYYNGHQSPRQMNAFQNGNPSPSGVTSPSSVGSGMSQGPVLNHSQPQGYTSPKLQSQKMPAPLMPQQHQHQPHQLQQQQQHHQPLQHPQPLPQQQQQQQQQQPYQQTFSPVFQSSGSPNLTHVNNSFSNGSFCVLPPAANEGANHQQQQQQQQYHQYHPYHPQQLQQQQQQQQQSAYQYKLAQAQQAQSPRLASNGAAPGNASPRHMQMPPVPARNDPSDSTGSPHSLRAASPPSATSPHMTVSSLKAKTPPVGPTGAIHLSHRPQQPQSTSPQARASPHSLPDASSPRLLTVGAPAGVHGALSPLPSPKSACAPPVDEKEKAPKYKVHRPVQLPGVLAQSPQIRSAGPQGSPQGNPHDAAVKSNSSQDSSVASTPGPAETEGELRGLISGILGKAHASHAPSVHNAPPAATLQPGAGGGGRAQPAADQAAKLDPTTPAGAAHISQQQAIARLLPFATMYPLTPGPVSWAHANGNGYGSLPQSPMHPKTPQPKAVGWAVTPTVIEDESRESFTDDTASDAPSQVYDTRSPAAVATPQGSIGCEVHLALAMAGHTKHIRFSDYAPTGARLGSATVPATPAVVSTPAACNDANAAHGSRTPPPGISFDPQSPGTTSRILKMLRERKIIADDEPSFEAAESPVEPDEQRQTVVAQHA